MSVGNGACGLRDRIRSYADLLDDTGADRRPLIEFAPGVAIAPGSWVLDSGTTWRAQAHYVIGGILRDIVGVQVGVEPRDLTRRTSVAAVNAAAGSYFANIADPLLGERPSWDDGYSDWDDGITVWDTYQALNLYIRMPDSSNPNDSTVVVLLGFYYSTVGQSHAVLLPNILPNGNMELWTGSTINTWSTLGVGAAQDTDRVQGSYAARLLGPDSRIEQVVTLMTGTMYRLSGAYKFSEHHDAGAELRVVLGDESGGTKVYVDVDGRTIFTTPDALLAPKFLLRTDAGQWRRFIIDFLAPTTAVKIALRFVSAASADSALLDNIQLQQVLRFAYYEPRIAAGFLPELEFKAQNMYMGSGQTVQLGQVSLLNGDARPETELGGLLLPNRLMKIVVGGRFSDGSDIYREDMRTRFFGLVQEASGEDDALAFQLEDLRNRAHVTIPPNKFPDKDYQNIEPQKKGAPRPICLCFNFCRPIGVDRDSTTGYRTYEMTDGSLGAAQNFGLVADGVFVYPNSELGEQESGELYPLILGTHYTLSADKTRFSIIDDVRNYRYTRSGEQVGTGARFDFDVGGGALSAAFDMVGPASKVAADLQATMRAASGAGDIFVTYSHTTHKFTTSKSAGTLNLRGETGPNASFNYWQYLGYNSGDKTGSLSYVGDDVTFESADADHGGIRVLAYGYVDDAAGTMTGVPNSLIKKQAHMAWWILKTIMQIPADQIDAASFQAAAALESGTSGANNDHGWLYLDEEKSTAEVLAMIEAGLMADLVVDGNGVWYLRPYELLTGIAAEFTDRDYLSFKMKPCPAEEIFRRTRVFHGFTHTSKRWRITESADFPDVTPKYGRLSGQPREIYTTIASFSTDPSHRPRRVTDAYQRLAKAAPWHVEFSARGKLVDLIRGDLISVTRTRGLYPGGRLDAVEFRVLGVRRDDISGVGTCTAVENVPIL